MSNFQTFAMITEGNTSTAPNQFVASTSDSLATVLAAGYMTDLSTKVKANDIIWINYADLSTFPVNTGESSTPGQFMVTYSSSVWSLIQVPASTLQTSVVSFNAVALNAMYTTPIELVPAPGANYMHVLDSMSLVQTYGSAAHTGGGVAAVQFDSTANGAGVIASSTLAAATFQGTASTVLTFNRGVIAAPFATCANKGLYLSNVTAVFAAGTGTTYVAHVNYHVIAVA